MKTTANESFECWAQRVERYEYGRALMRLAQGDDPVQVLEETSQRIINKLQHPIITSIRETVVVDYNPEQSLEDYKKNYLNKFGPKADHIKDH